MSSGRVILAGTNQTAEDVAYIFEQEACDAGSCARTPNGGSDSGGAPDGGTAHDATSDATLTRDSGALTDSGTHETGHDASTGPAASDASLRAHAGLYVKGPVGCGCRVARTEETGGSRWWLAVGVIALTVRRRGGSVAPTSARRTPNSAAGT